MVGIMEEIGKIIRILLDFDPVEEAPRFLYLAPPPHPQLNAGYNELLSFDGSMDFIRGFMFGARIVHDGNLTACEETADLYVN